MIKIYHENSLKGKIWRTLFVKCRTKYYNARSNNKIQEQGRLQLSQATLIRLIYARLIFGWNYFRRCQNQNFSSGFIFADGQISVISRGLIFAVDKIYLCLNKQKKLKDLDMKIAYIFPQCIYNKYYTCNVTKSLLLLTIHHHYFHHLNVQRRSVF